MSKAFDKWLKRVINEARCPACGGICDYMEYEKVTGKDSTKIHDCECDGSFP